MSTKTSTTTAVDTNFAGNLGVARQPATYRSTDVPRYNGNPLIEALPPILTEAQAVKQLTYYPPYKESDRQLPNNIRIHQLQTLHEVFIPQAIHADLNQRIAVTIRNGLVGRNPADLQHWSNINDRVRGLQDSNRPPTRGSAPGFNIIGISGGGKTTSINQNLSLYPQVIEHHEYKRCRLKTTQVVYLIEVRINNGYIS